ncbi:helix-hairpin-helix domain-containing protein, partial [Hyella patelloides]|uniref:helix-hairpin-helix domain-containing protein n=1 Tax=Hyella patelloides TaxID=1982969 RepID=UPI0011A33B3C
IYAGNKINRFSWINLGIFITALGLILSSTHLSGFVWLAQMTVAFLLKDKYIEHLNDYNKLPNITQTQAQLLPATTSKIDINNCSQDDLVYGLGLPIVYANEIKSAQNEGHIFTHIEELADIAGIPDSYLQRLEHLIIFSYDIKKEADFSWRKCNNFSKEELIACNLEPEVVAKIIQEREKAGLYQSFPDLRKRTGLPLKKLTALL